MTSRRLILLIAIAGLAVPGAATAEDLATASPHPLFDLAGLSMPSDVAIGKDGQVYVIDGGNHQVAVFDANGVRVTSLGMMGSDEGQFLDPLGIGIGPGGDIYVADKGNKRLVVFDASGGYRRAITLEADGDAVVPVDVAVDARGRELFVTDNAAHRVTVFDDKGRFLRAFGGEGEGDGQFRYPATLDIDAGGNVYVVDVLNARVQKFSADGTWLATIGELGGRAGTFFRPKGVAVDESGRVYVSDSFLGVIQVFNASGGFCCVLGDAGVAQVFETPVGLDIRGTRLVATLMLAGKASVLEPALPTAVAEGGR